MSDIIVGLDAEWVFESKGHNHVLSYQFAVHNAASGRTETHIIYTIDGKRITLQSGLEKAFSKAKRSGVISEIPERFVMTGHFIRSDFSTLKNFHVLKRRVSAVRKTYATTKMPMRLKVGTTQCHIKLVDTTMLTPAGTPLATIGDLLGEPKVELPDGYTKDRMDLFLQDHPTLFETYAVTDAVIPAKWVARTYGLLRDKLGINKKVITLGGAAVELVRIQARGKSINLDAFLGQDKNHTALPHLAPLLAIAAQAYHGACNVATALGYSPEGQTLNDFDIRAAYPTAVADRRAGLVGAALHRAASFGGDRGIHDGGAGSI
jgi:hypothetical protein